METTYRGQPFPVFDLLTIRIHRAEAALAVSVVDVEEKDEVDSFCSAEPAFYSDAIAQISADASPTSRGANDPHLT